MITSKEFASRKVIIFSTEAKERSEISHLLQTNQIATLLIEEDSSPRALALVKSGGFDICIIGTALEDDEKLYFIEKAQKTGSAALLVVMTPGNNRTNEYLEAGAHAVLPSPVTVSALRSSMLQSLQVFEREQLMRSVAHDEHITNLPWILESVARRLDMMAERLRAENLDSISGEERSAVMQRIILHALSTSNTPEDEGVDELLRWLIMRRQ